MKILNNKFKMNTQFIESDSRKHFYGYKNNAIYEEKIWPEMIASNKEIRNAFIVSSVEAFNKRLTEYFI